MTVFGGAVAVPRAVRSSDSTTTMRVNAVIMTRIDGATDSTVNSAINWIARSVTPPLPWPRLMLMSCANAGPASDPAAISVATNKTLRGKVAGLTKGSLDGPAVTPSRLPDSQSRSLSKVWPLMAVSAVRCEGRCGQAAAPARPEGHGGLGRGGRARHQLLVARCPPRRHRFAAQFGTRLGTAAQRFRRESCQRIAASFCN